MSPDPADDRDPPVRVLTVCTGNICRSPYAAALLRDGLEWARPGAFEVASAGTHALVGRPMDPSSERLLAERGVKDPSFRARLLNPRLVAAQDLVLVMTAQHRELVLDEVPSAHRRTLGILDLAAGLDEVGDHAAWARVLDQVGAEDVRARWRSLPDVLAAQRGRSAGRTTDVADPYKRGDVAFARMAVELDAAARTIVLWESGFSR
jgi:protein-tyrosine phosphatase